MFEDSPFFNKNDMAQEQWEAHLMGMALIDRETNARYFCNWPYDLCFVVLELENKF